MIEIKYLIAIMLVFVFGFFALCVTVKFMPPIKIKVITTQVRS
jgi:hypothetical protein